MKPIHLNLASQPFRDYRPLYAAVVVTSLLIAFLMLNNIDTYYRYVRETETTRQEIERVEGQVAQERRLKETTTAQIASIDLETLSGQTQFINARLAERAFSWSELLDRLEGVIPNNVRITSISPSFREDGTVELRIAFEAKSSDSMLVTMNRFTASPFFSNPFPNQDVSDELYRFGLTVEYKPSIPRGVKVSR